MTLATAPSSTAPTTTDVLPLWVFGATGMMSGELIRLAAGHPRLRLAGAVSREVGRPVPARQGAFTIDSATAAVELRETLAAGAERVVVVLGLPHGASSTAWSDLEDVLGPAAERVVVVDLAGDHRVANDEFVYGLPELNRAALPGATRIAAPGCFATALQLAAAPAAALGLADPNAGPWVFSAVTGSSGSGNEPKPGTHHPHRHANLWAYALGGHRHEAELTQELAKHDVAPNVVFVPHSGPFVRGIHLTAVLPRTDASPGDARAAYADFYAGSPFVDVLESGVPDLHAVVGSNRAQLTIEERDGSLLVLVTLDNLIKGGAGQALQALNVALDLPEDLGLPRAGLGVI